MISKPLLLFLIFACNSSAQNGSYTNIQPDGLDELLNSKDVTIIDVRTPQEWEGGIVDGALTININGPGFVNQIGELDKDENYLIYCRTGNRSRTASRIMTEHGFENIYNFDGMHTQIRSER